MKRVAAIGLFAFVLCGCSWQQTLEKLATEEDAFARGYLDAVRSGDKERARALLVAEGRETATDEMFTTMRSLLDRGARREVTLVGGQVNTQLGSGRRTTLLTYQIHDAFGFVMVEFRIRHEAGELLVDSLRLTPLPDDLREIHALRIWDKGPAHWLVLLAFAGELALIIYALVACARTPMRRRKWLWILFILCGVGVLTFDWTSGEIVYRILQLQLFGIGFSKAGPYAPWTLSLSFPIGALVFLACRPRHVAAATAASSLPRVAPPPEPPAQPPTT
jgi:hypothetical protein